MESAVGDSAYIMGFDVRPLAKMQLVGWNRPWLYSELTKHMDPHAPTTILSNNQEW